MARRPDIFISYGMVRSGSTLAFSMVRHALENSGMPQQVLPQELLGREAERNFWGFSNLDQLEDIADEAARLGTCLVLKTHLPPNEAAEKLLRSGRARGHAAFRDPREITLSLLDYAEHKRNRGDEPSDITKIHERGEARDRLDLQIEKFRKWTSLPNIVPWYYDDFAWDPLLAFTRLVADNKLEGSPDELANTFDRQRRVNFNKAVKARWQSEMTQSESADFLETYKGYFRDIKLDRLALKNMGLWRVVRFARKIRVLP